MPTSSSSTRSACPAGRSSTPASTWCATSSRADLLAVLAAALLVACKGTAVEPPDAAQSPQASAEPPPLANVAAAANATTNAASALDGGALPEPMRADRELTTDLPREPSRELLAKDLARDPKE